MGSPQFSIVIPAYNAEDTIARAVDSVINQNQNNWELIVVDDGSTDSTLDLLMEYAKKDSRIHWKSKSNGGTASALNLGARAAIGEFITQFGADDELLPHYTEFTAQMVTEHPGFDIYASNAYMCQPSGEIILNQQDPRFQTQTSLTLEEMIEAPQIYGSAAFRRKFFDQVGGFNEATYNEDYDFWLRIFAAGAKHIYKPEPLAVYYVREGQKTSDTSKLINGDIAILKNLISSEVLSEEQVRIARKSIAHHKDLLRSVKRGNKPSTFFDRALRKLGR